MYEKIIKQWILPTPIIIDNGWAHANINEIDGGICEQLVVNHSLNLKDPSDFEINTQIIKCTWMDSKINELSIWKIGEKVSIVFIKIYEVKEMKEKSIFQHFLIFLFK